MYDLFKSIIDTDRAPVVVCNLDHIIVYMNRSATEHYKKYSGESLTGKSLLTCHNEKSCESIRRIVAWFSESKDNNMIYTYRDDSKNKDVYTVALRDGDNKLIGYYEKHEYRGREKAKLYDFSASLI